MRDLKVFENVYVSGGIYNSSTTHVEVTAINAAYVHISVVVSQQPTQVPAIVNKNNIYVNK